MVTDITVGIAGAAGDGLDRTGETLARVTARLGLHVYTYNSYQSIIRGGHTWLRLRISEERCGNHGDALHALVALNQDSIERHAGEVESGGAVLFNSAKLHGEPSLLREGVTELPLPVPELTKELGRIPPVMQNTVALGSLVYLIGLDVEIAADILLETFKHKGTEVVEQNIGALRAGYDHAAATASPLGLEWNFTRKRRSVVTGNQMIAMGAVAAGCNFYSAYPMSPATSILHWLAAHSEQLGVVVKQAEDELAVANIAIGAGHAGVRPMCATSGGGFALMTEAIGMAGILESPVVFVNVMRGGPSTGLPTKQEQGDLNQAFGASQGDFPRMIVAPKDAIDCYNATAEAFNIADVFQMPVILLSDLLLAEHRATVGPDEISPDVKIDRGEWAETDAAQNGDYHRYKITPSGVSPRQRPGIAGGVHVAGSDEHDEKGILISDEHTNAAIRRKMHEKRMRKMDGVLASLPAPELEGPEDAEVTLVGWGSSWSAIQEACARLAAQGVTANHLQFKYLVPFHAKEAREILGAAQRTMVVEANFSGQFARHLRAETSFSVDHLITKYDGEPLTPDWIAAQVRARLAGEPESLQVEEEEAREMAYHYARIRMKDKTRPGRIEKISASDGAWPEPVWEVELVDRSDANTRGKLVIGMDTGSVHSFEQKAGK